MKTTRKMKIGIIFASVLGLMAVASAQQRSSTMRSYNVRALSGRIRGVPVKTSVVRVKHKLSRTLMKVSCTRTRWDYTRSSHTTTTWISPEEKCRLNHSMERDRYYCINNIGAFNSQYEKGEYHTVTHHSSDWVMQANIVTTVAGPCSSEEPRTYTDPNYLKKHANKKYSAWTVEDSYNKHLFGKYSESERVNLRYVRDEKISSCVVKQIKVVKSLLQSSDDIRTMIKRVNIKMVEMSFPKRTFDAVAADKIDSIEVTFINYNIEKKVLNLNVYLNSKRGCTISDSNEIHEALEEE